MFSKNRKFKTILSLLVAVMMIAGLFAITGCQEEEDETPYIAVVSKGFQHQFWQVVKDGADAAAEEFGVEITFEGPASESEIQAQVQMLDSALARNPSAIALAALSTESVIDQLNSAMSNNIPVIGFDSGVPEAPEGSVHANASTDNTAAGALAAENMYPAIADRLGNGSRIAVISQDATSESVTNRTYGFINEMVDLLEADGYETIAVVGHDRYSNNVPAADADVVIDVGISATTGATDIATTASSLLGQDNVIAIYGSNEAAANGILQASNEGSDLTANNIVAVGFDAGERQKAAVRAGHFLGSITQDPFNIGYKAVELAYRAYNGESVSDVDTGAKFYTSENMDDDDIIDLVYD